MHVHTEQYTPSVTCLPAREDDIIREVEEDGDLSAEIHKVLTAIEQLLKKAEPLKAAKPMASRLHLCHQPSFQASETKKNDT